MEQGVISDNEIVHLVERFIDANLLQRFSKRRVVKLFLLIQKCSFSIPGLHVKAADVRFSVDALLAGTRFVMEFHANEAVLSFFDEASCDGAWEKFDENPLLLRGEDPLIVHPSKDIGTRFVSVLKAVCVALVEAESDDVAAGDADLFAPVVNVRPRPLLPSFVPACLTRELESMITEQQGKLTAIQDVSGKDNDMGYWKKSVGKRFEYFKTSSDEFTVGLGSEGVVYYAREKDASCRNGWFACKEIYAPDQRSTREYEALVALQKKGRSRLLVHHEAYVPPQKHTRNGFLFLELAVADLEKLVLRLGPVALTDHDVRLFLLRKVAEPLSDVHDGGHVHRDVRPPNFLLYQHGIVKLSDFGFSRPYNTLLSQTLLRAECLQPFEVCSLKQGVPAPKLPKSDVFQLGMTFFFIVTGGFYPFGDHSLKEQRRLIEMRAEPSVAWMARKIDDPFLEHLLLGMLTHDLDKRYTLQNVMEHPYFWDHNRREEYVKRFWESKFVGPVERHIDAAYKDKLDAWANAVPLVSQLLEPGQGRNKASFQGLVTCLRHGFTHAAEWREGRAQRGSVVEQQAAASFMLSSGKWKTLNEFWFRHRAVAWLVPACFDVMVEQSRISDGLRMELLG